MNCPTCGAAAAPGTRYCNECGSRVAQEAPPAPAAPAAAAADAADPLRRAIDSALGHQYDILRLLGRGGMGAVYLARDRALERAVAIKVLPPEVASTADAIERFKREARTVANLTHPNIVPLYAFGEAAARDAAGARGATLGYYVMGYVRGESLAARMAREGRVPPEETRRLLAELADALDFAHRQGVVHRDIKPDNILIDDATGRPMLTDFGIAKGRNLGQTLTQIGTVMGTPHYMSPEQAAGDRDIDGRSDLYSLGVVGYAMLAGRVPFEGKTLHEILLQHVTAPVPPLAALAPDAPADLVAAVERCLQKDPAQRWQDGKSLRQALGSDESKELPPDLQPLIGTGLLLFFSSLLSAILIASALLRGGYLAGIWWPWGFYPLLPSLFGPLNEARQAHKQGYGWRRIVQIMYWQPKWWPFWWPRRFRRPGDVYDRIPKAIRRMRVAFSLGLLMALGLSLLLLVIAPLLDGPWEHAPLAFDRYGGMGWLSNWRDGLVIAPILIASLGGSVLMLLTLPASMWWGWRRGLSRYISTRLVGSSTLSAFWTRPEVIPILAPVDAGARAVARRDPQTPHELVRAIADSAEQLAGPARGVGSQAITAAREVVADIEALDQEIAELAASVDDAELARLEQRIAVLDAQGGELDERRQMRALLVTQHELLRRVQARHEAALARRERLAGMLHSLWGQLVELRSQGGPTPQGGVSGTTDSGARVLALVGEIQRTSGAAVSVAADRDEERVPT